MDTVETFLPPDSPAVEWDPLAFMTGEEEQQVMENQLPEPVESHSRTVESCSQGIENIPDEELQRDMEEIALQVTDSYGGTRLHFRTQTMNIFVCLTLCMI